MPWDFNGYLSAYDAGAIRRGHQVYSQVCASCHGLRAIAYRNLVGVCYSEDEANALAQDIEVMDGPNDEGEMFEREGKLSDFPLALPQRGGRALCQQRRLPPGPVADHQGARWWRRLRVRPAHRVQGCARRPPAARHAVLQPVLCRRLDWHAAADQRRHR